MIPNSSLLRRPTRRLRGIAVAAVAVLVTLACGGGDKSTGPQGIAGRYNIVSVNGPAGFDNSAPFRIYDATVENLPVIAEVTGGFVNLGSDGRYSGDATVNIYIGGVLWGTDDSFGGLGSGGGRYTLSGTTVTFDPDDPELENITAEYTGGNTLTFVVTTDDPGGVGTVTVTIVMKK